jgi:quercetin dioxygenase-like cupin family protein
MQIRRQTEMRTQTIAPQGFKAVFPPEGKPLAMMSEAVRIRLRGDDTGGAYSVIEDETPPEAGPPLHVHSPEDETFYVVEGEYEIKIGEARFTATPPAFLPAPKSRAPSTASPAASPNK